MLQVQVHVQLQPSPTIYNTADTEQIDIVD